MQPTDQGMCCSFNKQKAEEMYVEGRYQEHVIKMTEQDAKQARDGSRLPEGWADLIYHLEKCVKNIFLTYVGLT